MCSTPLHHEGPDLPTKLAILAQAAAQDCLLSDRQLSAVIVVVAQAKTDSSHKRERVKQVLYSRVGGSVMTVTVYGRY
jgi:hypothetical protein